MYPKIKLHLNDDNLIDVINYLDQKNIVMEFNHQQLYQILIDNKKYEEILFFLDRGTDIKDFLYLCKENNIDVIYILIGKMLDESENPGEILLNLINELNYKLIQCISCIYKFRIDEIWNYSDGKPLRLAVRKGDTAIIRLLFASGSKINKCSIDPIIDALVTGKPDLLRLLLREGSNVANIKPEHLEICLKKKYRLCVDFIYEKIINDKLPHFKNMDVSKCIEEAKKNKNYELSNLLTTICRSRGSVKDKKKISSLRSKSSESSDSDSDSDESDESSDKDRKYIPKTAITKKIDTMI